MGAGMALLMGVHVGVDASRSIHTHLGRLVHAAGGWLAALALWPDGKGLSLRAPWVRVGVLTG